MTLPNVPCRPEGCGCSASASCPRCGTAPHAHCQASPETLRSGEASQQYPQPQLYRLFSPQEIPDPDMGRSDTIGTARKDHKFNRAEPLLKRRYRSLFPKHQARNVGASALRLYSYQIVYHGLWATRNETTTPNSSAAQRRPHRKRARGAQSRRTTERMSGDLLWLWESKYERAVRSDADGVFPVSRQSPICGND